jgi:anti-sigma regulatory factor (Ser/Thr protein kinase)
MGGYRHEALIYGSDDELLEVAVPFLRAGVAAGEPTLLRLRDEPRAAVLDALGGAGGLALLPHDESITPLACLRTTRAMIEDLVAARGRPVRVFGEIPHDPWPAWARYEAAVNVVLDPLPLWGVCPYDTRETPAAVVAEVERTHPLVATADLDGHESRAFEDPLTFLEDHARRHDVLAGTPPDTELTDPEPHWAGEIVRIFADATSLEVEARESLRLATIAVVANAVAHGRPPTLVRIWAYEDAVTVAVSDGGPGTPDLLTGVLSQGGSAEASRSLYHVREAVTEVAMFRGPDGFTVRLVQRRR